VTSSLRSGGNERIAPFGALGLVLIGLLAIGGAVLGVRHGASPRGLVVTACLAIAVELGVVQLRRRWLGPLWLLTIVAGLVLARSAERPLAYVWVGFLLVGQAVGLQLRHRRQEQRRARAGLPPTPRPRRTPGPGAQVRVVQDDGDEQVETVDAPPADVRAALAALDGGTRTALSVLRGDARLDVGGDASGPMVVYQCDDVAATGLPAWFVVSSSGDPWAGAEIDLRLVGVDAHLPSGAVTTLEPALAALDAFLLTGGRAPGLPWCTGRDVDDLRAIFEALA
jgi:hypothetical protein